MDRRSFLLTAAAAQRVLGANDRIRTGIIGAGGRGRYLTGQFKEIGAEMAAVCDVYEPNLQAGLKEANTGAKPFRNYHKLLDDKSIDAVIVATPDHWHARMVIDAVEAGKDVYCEKPMAHTIPETYAIVEAVRRTKRVVQVGMQRRSSELFQEGKKIVDSGQIGVVKLVTSAWYNYVPALRKHNLEGDLDWKQWSGSTPERPMDPERFFNWYYFADYSGGMLVGQGAHIIDCILWYMNSTMPLAVTCTGGKAMPGADFPQSGVIAFEYPEYFATFTLGYEAMQYSWFNDQIKQFHGNKGRLDVGREWYVEYPQQKTAIEMKSSAENKKPGSFATAAPAHIRNFLECIKTRKDPNAPVEAGQATAIVLAMAMDSLRAGRRLKWNGASRKAEV